jgi:hypothetical protein
MNIQLLILIIITLISVASLVYIIEKQKLRKYYLRIIKAETNIDNKINEKIDLVENINKILTKGSNKKDYLKDYLKKLEGANNYEKDIVLNDCTLIINDLIHDNKKISNNKEMKKLLKDFKNVDEELISNKTIFNNNMNNLKYQTKNIIKKIVAITSNYKDKKCYEINKTDDGIN